MQLKFKPRKHLYCYGNCKIHRQHFIALLHYKYTTSLMDSLYLILLLVVLIMWRTPFAEALYLLPQKICDNVITLCIMSTNSADLKGCDDSCIVSINRFGRMWTYLCCVYWLSRFGEYDVIVYAVSIKSAHLGERDDICVAA